MPSERRMWVVVNPHGKIMWDTVDKYRTGAVWLGRMEVGGVKDANEFRKMGYRAVRVRCVVEDEVDGKDAT